MKSLGMILSLLFSAVIIYMTYHAYFQNSKNSADPLGLVRPLEKARDVQTSVNLSAVQTAVQTYQIQQGAFPKSLEDLVSSGLITGAQIKNLNYDPETGKVTITGR